MHAHDEKNFPKKKPQIQMTNEVVEWRTNYNALCCFIFYKQGYDFCDTVYYDGSG